MALADDSPSISLGSRPASLAIRPARSSVEWLQRHFRSHVFSRRIWRCVALIQALIVPKRRALTSPGRAGAILARRSTPGQGTSERSLRPQRALREPRARRPARRRRPRATRPTHRPLGATLEGPQPPAGRPPCPRPPRSARRVMMLGSGSSPKSSDLRHPLDGEEPKTHGVEHYRRLAQPRDQTMPTRTIPPAARAASG